MSQPDHYIVIEAVPIHSFSDGYYYNERLLCTGLYRLVLGPLQGGREGVCDPAVSSGSQPRLEVHHGT